MHPKVEGSRTKINKKIMEHHKANSRASKKFFVCRSVAIRVPR